MASAKIKKTSIKDGVPMWPRFPENGWDMNPPKLWRWEVFLPDGATYKQVVSHVWASSWYFARMGIEVVLASWGVYDFPREHIRITPSDNFSFAPPKAVKLAVVHAE